MNELISLQLGDVQNAAYQNGTSGNAKFKFGKFADGSNVHGAVRFPVVNVAQGITVLSATLRVWSQYSTATASALKGDCYGIKETNTAAFSSNPFGRTKTTHSTSINTSRPSNNYLPIDVTDIVNEILGQSEWVSGNAMGFFCIENGSNNDVEFEDWILKANLSIKLTTDPDVTPDPVTIDAPTFPSTSDYGIRVSEPNVDVKTATESQLYFTSRKKEFRVKTELETTDIEIPHGLSYAPCVLGFYTDVDGKHIMNFPFNPFDVGAVIISDATNVYWSSVNLDPVYLYIFIDPLT